MIGTSTPTTSPGSAGPTCCCWSRAPLRWYDVARGRPGRAAAGVGERDPAGAVRGALYARLEAETGLSAGYKQCGGVIVARTEDRMTQLRRTAATADAYGLECALLTPDEALERWPADAGRRPARRDLAARRRQGQPHRPDPGAGQGRPAGRRHGWSSGPGSLDVLTRDGAVTGVRTDRGDVEAEVVVNCAGQWAAQVGAMAGVAVPLHSAEHFYVVTDQIEGVHPDLPILRDPDGWTYFKEEVGGLVVGGFEPEAKPWVAAGPGPLPVRVRAARRGLGPLLGPDGQRAAPDPGARRDRDPQVLQRPRVASRRTTSS